MSASVFSHVDFCYHTLSGPCDPRANLYRELSRPIPSNAIAAETLYIPYYRSQLAEWSVCRTIGIDIPGKLPPPTFQVVYSQIRQVCQLDEITFMFIGNGVPR